ncbi:MAG: helix-turn-helix transcriptional regulator [Spirochaetales bacterium]|nr:helix-turn-helix transcriptional regulator [Spirochaetales bacterium]
MNDALDQRALESVTTIGREFYKGAVFGIRTSDRPEVLEDAYGQDVYQIILITEGSVILSDGDEKTALLPPQLACLSYANPMKKLDIAGAKGFSIFFIPKVINYGLFNSFPQAAGEGSGQDDALLAERLLIKPFKQGEISNPFHIAVNPALEERVTDMYRGLRDQFSLQPNEFWPCRGRSYFLELLMLLQNLYAFEGDTDLKLALPTGDALAEQAVRQMLLSYSDSRLKCSSLRGETGRFAFSARFRTAAGMPCKEYLKSIRLTVAANLMRNTMLPPTDIAERTGYADRARFERDFRKRFGKKPAEYRADFPNPYG